MNNHQRIDLSARTQSRAVRPGRLQDRGRGGRRDAGGPAPASRAVQRDRACEAPRVAPGRAAVRPRPPRDVADAGGPPAARLGRSPARARRGGAGRRRRRRPARAAPHRRHGEHGRRPPAAPARRAPRPVPGARGGARHGDVRRAPRPGPGRRAERRVRRRRRRRAGPGGRSGVRRGAGAHHPPGRATPGRSTTCGRGRW